MREQKLIAIGTKAICVLSRTEWTSQIIAALNPVYLKLAIV